MRSLRSRIAPYRARLVRLILLEEAAGDPALRAHVRDLAPARASGVVLLRLGHTLPLLERHVVGAAVVLETTGVEGDLGNALAVGVGRYPEVQRIVGGDPGDGPIGGAVGRRLRQ